MKRYIICIMILMLATSFVQVKAQGESKNVITVKLDPRHIEATCPCPTQVTTQLSIRNNTLEALTVDWAGVWDHQDFDCATDFAPNSGTWVIPAQQEQTTTITITLTPGNDCRDYSVIKFQGEAQGFPGQVSDDEVRIDCCRQGPTLTEWGQVILVVLMIASGLVILLRRRRAKLTT